MKRLLVREVQMPDGVKKRAITLSYDEATLRVIELEPFRRETPATLYVERAILRQADDGQLFLNSIHWN